MEDIQKICAKTEGANGDLCSSFQTHGKVMAINIPRESIKAEMLTIIDLCKNEHCSSSPNITIKQQNCERIQALFKVNLLLCLTEFNKVEIVLPNP